MLRQHTEQHRSTTENCLITFSLHLLHLRLKVQIRLVPPTEISRQLCCCWLYH